ncbi:hypothetical protein J31TS4_24080 [Paenibacillus sp. J31TS4]|nr:hypothetical protein J31TS4_24080 [Paenibacillus sp. J31TS4]
MGRERGLGGKKPDYIRLKERRVLKGFTGRLESISQHLPPHELPVSGCANLFAEKQENITKRKRWNLFRIPISPLLLCVRRPTTRQF